MGILFPLRSTHTPQPVPARVAHASILPLPALPLHNCVYTSAIPLLHLFCIAYIPPSCPLLARVVPLPVYVYFAFLSWFCHYIRSVVVRFCLILFFLYHYLLPPLRSSPFCACYHTASILAIHMYTYRRCYLLGISHRGRRKEGRRREGGRAGINVT